MGFDKYIQFYSKDGFYVFNPPDKNWYKICPVCEPPLDVRNQVSALIEDSNCPRVIDVDSRILKMAREAT